MNLNDFRNLDWNDINALNESDLKRYVRTGSFIANGYIYRARKGGYTSPGLRTGLEREKGAFTSKNKNINQLRAELKDILMFLDNDTLTKKAAEDFARNTIERVMASTDNVEVEKITKDDMENFWRVYNEILELADAKYGTREEKEMKLKNKFGFGSQKVQEYVFNIANRVGFSDLDEIKILVEDKKELESFKWLTPTKDENPFDI